MTRPLTDLELRYTGMMSGDFSAAYDRSDRIAVIWRLQVFSLSFRTSLCNHDHAPHSPGGNCNAVMEPKETSGRLLVFMKL